MPTLMAALAMWGFFPLCWWIYQKHEPVKATVLCVLIGRFFLPEAAAFDPPLLPDIKKTNIATFVCLGIMVLKHRPMLAEARVGRGPELIAMLCMLGLFGTYMTNPEPLMYGRYAGLVEGANAVYCPPLSVKDSLSYILNDLFTFIFPFVLGRVIARSRADLITFAYLNCIFGLIYLIPMFIELRLSPQVHNWIYGYPAFPVFAQSYRYGGWRPQIFFYHGLNFARCMMIVYFCGVMLHCLGWARIWKMSTVAFNRLMIPVIILIKSTGVIALLAFFGPLLRFGSTKLIVRVQALLGVLVIAYLAGQASGYLNTQQFIEIIRPYSEERAFSMEFRFQNEIELSKRAEKKRWFGWGGYNRGDIIDLDMGWNNTVIDGTWIGRYNNFGVVGLVTTFWLLLVPVLQTVRKWKRIEPEGDRRAVVVCTMIPVLYALECLPNSMSTNFGIFCCGFTYQIVTNMAANKR